MESPLPQDQTVANQTRITLWVIFRSYFVIGLTAFGMAILQKLKALVARNRWLTEEEMEEGLALVQLYPGPIMVDFTAFVGYRLRGVTGAVLAATGFILPTFVLMTGLSALYFAAGAFPGVHQLFLGLEAVVVGILFNVTIDMGGRSIQHRAQAIIMLLAFGALMFKVNAILIVLSALIAGALFIRTKGGKSQNGETPGRIAIEPDAATAERSSPKRWLGIGVVVGVILALAGFSWSLHSETGRVALSFFKIGSVAFGNGTTILPLVQASAVDSNRWLTMAQFADGIALSQITPGPFLIIATFIGYKIGGILGGMLATFAIFAPSVAMTLIFTELFSRLRNLKPVRGALSGVLASFVGLLAVVLLQLGSATLTGPAPIALSAGAFVAVRWFKLDILWVFLGGLLLWGGLLLSGVA